jgi:hypothetical protein
MATPQLRTALVYDWLDTQQGGVERILESFQELLPNATWCTATANPRASKLAQTHEVKTSFLQHLPPFLRAQRPPSLKLPEPEKIPGEGDPSDLDKFLKASNGQYGVVPQSHEDFVQQLRASGMQINFKTGEGVDNLVKVYKNVLRLEAQNFDKRRSSISNLTQNMKAISKNYVTASIKQMADTHDGLSSHIKQKSGKILKLIQDEKSEMDGNITVRSEFGINETISWKSNNAQVLRDGYIKLNDFVPTTEVEFELKTTGLTSIRLADAAYVDGDVEAGDFYRNLGLGLADALVGLDMVSGVELDLK